MSFNNFPDYQSLEKGSKGEPAKANRSIPDRIEEYGIMNYINKDSKVLDLGCNRGYFGTVLSPHIHSYVGIDSDTNQLKHAQRKGNMTLKNQEFSCQDGKFDVILSLAFHSYVNVSMKDYANCLDSMLAEDGTIFIEGHPPGYRGEPELYLNPLKENLKAKYCIIESRKVKDRELLRPFLILKRMQGMVSTCELDGDVIKKQYLPDTQENANRGINHHWKKELIAFKTLDKEDHVPLLIEHDDTSILMSYCGERISKFNIPKDWKKQCEEINELQRRHKLFHQDIKTKNICVKDGIIYLIDWGLWSDDKNRLQPIENVIKELL